MNYLYNLDLNENEILDIVDANDEVKDLSEEDMIKYIYILVDVGCTQKQIHNIITSNPAYFSRDNNDISSFLRRLAAYGVDVSSAIDENPWLLNKDAFELEEFVKEKRSLGIAEEEIIDNFIHDCF